MTWTDLPWQEGQADNLDFVDYCDVLTKIFYEADTPLTIGIFGPWGSGKTSLMRQVESRLAESDPAPIAVWFDAWKYDKEDALWRALIIRVLDALRTEFDPAGTEFAPLREERQAIIETLDDLEASLYRVVEREELGGVKVDWEKLLKGSVMGLTHLSLSALPGMGLVLGKMMEEAEKKITGQDVNQIFEAIQRERRQIYREHIRSLEQFQARFNDLIQNHVTAQGRRLVIFIDDLDRCLPEKAIEVLEALKLFLDAPGCLFFLGADREVIQRGIRVKYRGFLVDSDDPAERERRIPITGTDYLEKIVQLPFHLLPLDESRVRQFIHKSGISLPPGCSEIFAAGLRANPRQVKRSLNIFRLLHNLAQIRRDEFEGRAIEIKPQLLAKVVIIQGRHRELYNDIVEYPTLLQELERHFLDRAQKEPETTETTGEPTLLDKYRENRSLRRLLTVGDNRFADLPVAHVRAYLYLTYTTAESGQDAAENMSRKWWAQLLSGDLTKIKSAVAEIEADEEGAMAGNFRRRLLEVIEQVNSQSDTRRRFSAGTALALLGDPRHFEAMLDMPMGQYRIGADQASQQIEGFKIGRYPVTNRQYQKFLAENPGHPAPAHWQERKHSPETANQPVVNVSLGDAQAYCNWAGKYLPTVAQWKAAAGGVSGQRYPYGDELRPDAANTVETGLGGPSPVGLFPGGVGPLGAADMIGNVWEWTTTKKGNNHALKGGAWDTPQAEATVQAVLWLPPDTAAPNIGFRVVE